MKKIESIPSGSYVGYYWMSDAVDPVVVQNTDSSTAARINSILSSENANPFVIEGQLYDEKSKISVSIKYVDGHYILNRYDVEENIEDVDQRKQSSIVLKRYVANRMPGLKLRFLQYWREQPDPLCCGMPVLQPAEKVFVGFEPLKESEK